MITRNHILFSMTLLFCLLLSGTSSAQFEFIADRFMRNNATQIVELKKGSSKYGHAVIFLRGESNNRIKAKYFAEDAYNSYVKWKTGKDIVMISSGAYSTGWSSSTDTPVGLCVDNGTIVNRNIEDKLDGLVIVEAVGGIRVSDIDNKDLYLQSIDKKVSPRDDRYLLLNWGADQNATIFQTHLLAYTDGLRIDAYKSSKSTARRRLLVLGYFNGKLFHAIFHITQNVTLYQAADDVMKTMINMGVEVVSVLNLDTGGYDILEVYDDYRQKIPYIKGGVDKSKATNLLIYYYEK